MIVDLEAEKAVDSSKRLGLVSGYSQLCAALGILGLICDLAFQSLHFLYAWRDRGVDKHGNVEVALGKLYCNHRQMLADSLLASRISGLVTLNLDSTAVSQKMEMMSRFLVTEPHPLITTGIHARKIAPLTRRRIVAQMRSSTGD